MWEVVFLYNGVTGHCCGCWGYINSEWNILNCGDLSSSLLTCYESDRKKHEHKYIDGNYLAHTHFTYIFYQLTNLYDFKLNFESYKL